MLRLITDARISPEEAVRAYHGVLQGKGIKPHRSLENDLKLTDQAMSYDGSAARRTTVEVRESETRNPKSEIRKGESLVTSAPAATWPKRPDGSPDFDKMTSAQRAAYSEARLKRMFG
jgi:hypothetical protein